LDADDEGRVEGEAKGNPQIDLADYQERSGDQFVDFPNLAGAYVLITGGTGSFGKAFVEQALRFDLSRPERLIIFSRDEQKQEEMARKFDHKCMRYFVGDVRDSDRLEMAMRGVDYVIHAAALKIVPIAEYNPIEAIRTNIIGSENVVKASIRCGVRKVIALSTDKAVSPLNLYGATKLAAEKLFIAANNLSAGNPAFSVVRYGNVVGSRGSVIPYFRKLEAEGKALTVTDTAMTRFFITLPEAVTFVMNCLSRAKGREIFVPKIPSMRIMDLVAAMACKHVVVGIRPGEKIHETLITEDELRFVRQYKDHFVIQHEPVVLRERSEAYSSDRNDQWISVDRLQQLVDQC
jgi:UDP-N-acetylglucosamine 4,6-dehydratase